MLRFDRWQSLILPVGIISSVLVILVPLPAMLLDVLLAANITFAVIVLLTTIYVRRRWSSISFRRCCWPARLAAGAERSHHAADSDRGGQPGNVRRRRRDPQLWRICGERQHCGGDDHLCNYRGDQFVVITKGATRISEVAARFAHSTPCPGRQMAIDADLNAGVIDETRGPAGAGIEIARGGRLLRRDGRRRQVRPRRRRGRHHHHADQHRRRPDHRHVAIWHEPRRRRLAVHQAHHRRTGWSARSPLS